MAYESVRTASCSIGQYHGQACILQDHLADLGRVGEACRTTDRGLIDLVAYEIVLLDSSLLVGYKFDGEMISITSTSSRVGLAKGSLARSTSYWRPELSRTSFDSSQHLVTRLELQLHLLIATAS